jgi:hypothetical protein
MVNCKCATLVASVIVAELLSIGAVMLFARHVGKTRNSTVVGFLRSVSQEFRKAGAVKVAVSCVPCVPCVIVGVCAFVCVGGMYVAIEQIEIVIG